MDTVRKPHVYAEHVKQIYAIESVGLVGTMVNSAILCFVQRNVISHHILLAWFAILSGVTLLRFLLLRGYQRVPVEESQAGTWFALFIAGAACSGVLWGSAAIWMFPEDSTAPQVFLSLILGGMVAGTAAVYSAVMGAFLAYSLPALVPIAVRFLAGLRGIVLDITERKKIEEERSKAQRLESLGVLAGGLAHDFNNILTVIAGNISLIKWKTARRRRTT